MTTHSHTNTTPLIQDERLRARAYDRAISIAQSLSGDQSRDQRGLAGDGGDALLHMAALYATGESRYESAMHEALRRGARSAGKSSIGIFSGISGIRAVAELATAFEPRYAKLVNQCDAYVDTSLPAELAPTTVFWEYDLIAGWAGARLARCVTGARERDTLSERLAWLIEDWSRWRCPHPVDDSRKPVNDLGVAHGVAGILSALVLTHEALDAGESENVRRCASLLESYAIDFGPYLVWPNSPEEGSRESYRSSWCYGTIGVAASLYSVGVSIRDERLKASALDAQRRIARIPSRDLLIEELGICHGMIGNALCFASVAANADCPELSDAAEALVAATLDALDANGGISPSLNETGWHNRTNEIVGTGGIAIALLTMTGDMPSDWMRLHGLAPL